MKVTLRKLFSALVLACLGMAGGAFGTHSETARIVVYHTNDIHGRILRRETSFDLDEPASPLNRRGGFAALAGHLKNSPTGYLLLDSGDFFQGTPEGDWTRGDAVLECMNALGYDALALGNHDFDQGSGNVERLSKLAKFPFLSANLLDAATGRFPPFARPYILKEIDGMKVAVIGLTTSRMRYLTFAENFAGLRFQREADALAPLVARLRREGAQVIIVAAHVGFESKDSPAGFEGEKFLAARVPGIHLIVGGHTHAPLEEPYQDPKNKTLIVHNRSGLQTVTETVLRVHRKDAALVSYYHRTIPLEGEQPPDDPEIAALVAKLAEPVAAQADVVLGTAAAAMERKGPEAPLGNWVADVMRDFAKTDVAFQNIGGIRSDLPAGPLTVRRLYWVLPFENTIVTLELTGAQIRRALEHGVAGHGPLQVSGLTMAYDPSRPPGRRVTNVAVDGKPLDDAKTYTAATNNFVASGGDGFGFFKNGRNLHDTGKRLRDAAAEWVQSHPPLDARIEGRIVEQPRPKR